MAGRPKEKARHGPVAFGGRVAEARKLAGLSTRALALAAGLAPSHVHQIESETINGTRVTLGTAAKLASATGVRVEWLAYGSGSPTACP